MKRVSWGDQRFIWGESFGGEVSCEWDPETEIKVRDLPSYELEIGSRIGWTADDGTEKTPLERWSWPDGDMNLQRADRIN